MDERTEDLRDLFTSVTGEESATESQSADRGTLVDGAGSVEERLEAVVAEMRAAVGFEVDRDDAALARVVRGFFDGETDAAMADALDTDAATVARMRLDLHLLREADGDTPVDTDRLATLLDEGADPEEAAATLDTDAETVRWLQSVRAAVRERRATNRRWYDAFAAVATEADLASRYTDAAQEDGLKEAAEDIETTLSF